MSQEISIDAPDPIPLDTNHIPFKEREGLDVFPDDNRMVVLLNLAHEEWRWDKEEPFKPLGVDHHSLKEAGMNWDWSMKSATKYGAKIGLPRLLDVLDRRNITTSLVLNAAAAVHYPEEVADAHDRGHEIVAHGYSEGTPPSYMSREEQREDIETTMQVIEDITGESPKGWISPGAAVNQDTLDILADNDFLFEGSLQDDELPYFIDNDGHQMVEIPFRMIGMLNDEGLYVNWETRQPLDHDFDLLKSTFDAYYQEASRRPLIYRYAVHPLYGGHPDAAHVYSQFLDYMQSFDDVWIASYGELAEYWMDEFGDGYGL